MNYLSSSFKPFIKQGLPLCFFIMAIFIDRSNLLHINSFQPILIYAVIYYWSLYRPDWIFVPGLFICGIIQDVVSGMTLGQTSLIFLALYGIVLQYVEFFKSTNFLLTWSIFIIGIISLNILMWVCMVLSHDGRLAPDSFIYQGIWDGLAFSLVHFFLTHFINCMRIDEWD